MSNSNGFELDFGFGSLLDTGNSNSNSTNNGNFAFGGGDYGTANLTSLANSMNMNGTQAQDFLSLFNDNFPSASVTGTTTTSNTANTNNAVSNNWQKNAKALFDQQQQQQLLEQNSLNALLSQHTQQQQQQQNFLSDLDVTVNQTTQASSSAFAAASQQLNPSRCNGNNSNNGNYMFVATIVDPNQEDAPPQQMLFLPGSNQVIPMPSGTGASAGNVSGNSNSNNGTANGGQQGLMALANLPVVFNNNNNQQQNSQQSQQQQQQSFSNNFLLDRDSNWPAALQSLNASVAVNSNSNSNSMYSNNDDLLQQVAAQGLAPLDLTNFGNLGPTTSNDQSFQHLQLQQLQLQQSSLMMQQQQHVPSVSPASVPQEEKAAMPIRPLSAYNFFFSDERERILLNKTDDDVDDAELDNAKKQRLLLQHLAKDRSKRRPHRKTHGKINFTTLSKLIGQRWKQLPEDRKNFYREVAAIDLERYQRELRERSPANGTAAAAN